MINNITQFNYNSDLTLDNKNFIWYFLEIKSRKSKYTAKSYERDIKDFFCVSSIYDITIEDIKKVSILHSQNFIMNLMNKNMSSATINRKISSLSALYKWLLKYQDNSTGIHIIKYNPFGNLKEEKPVINNKETEFLTKEECKVLLNSIDTSTILGHRNKTILVLALTTALRKSEIINIKIKHITTHTGYDVVKVIRKGGKEDIVKIQGNVLTMINEYIRLTKRNKLSSGEEYLFIGHSTNGNNKEKLDASTLNYMIKRVCKNAGIDKDLRVHSTRHTAITLAILAGATVEKVRDFAAHKNLATTNRYIHSVDKLKNNAGDLIDVF
ncbi:tyrosine-type recombinase/integrase [Clostridium sp. CM028]|uniref:tyrosine-type recombinase/integrase n=1 Tax=unclassified Clostridium TaxID=2614128 RepID=UPI001C6DDBCC|nr:MULTISPECIES: tyrosine-type recombinase/integrase [unclassified Clostridium]MBW9144055.1 tyrosine-type recombinase/integrase [Clostridium sp. CM027]MBW9147634.1 tyrosine-type recombinase/integrase [Clostridium sp. CM028]UVE41294.1 tyrosine-type recombinase/integrase [Clostridium sp. CM027]WLC61964.1 tyrosine-type recombinase/integrase [Clostridium sp. CM028]